MSGNAEAVGEGETHKGALEARVLVRDLAAHVGRRVDVAGWILTRRDLGGIRFLVLRDRTGVVQCVLEGIDVPLHESCVRVSGKVVEQPRAPGGLEVQASALEVISAATVPPPVELSKEEWQANPDTLLQYRHVTVRSPKARAVLKIEAELIRGFRAYLDAHDFTEIYTPKLVSAGAEGGANLFEVDYYGRRAYLAQSPQLYKQIMVGVFERVYETAPVYRAEKSHTHRHLSEYLSLDVEFGFIEDDGDVMDLEEALLKSMLNGVAESCSRDLAALGAELPDTSVAFPRIELLAARELVAERYGHVSGGKDLDPEAERLVGRWAKEEHGSDFVFVTHYPQAARPFYTFPLDGGLTRGLDLLFRGVEITSGGQRVHRPEVLVEELRKRNMDPEAFADYIEVFRHGMPPHGGFAIGAERLTALLLGIHNVRFARAFPRDAQRLTP
ncbi:MAG TPA: aspartate--tRNA(Asn) ligase [Trueperaceae bacterium]|nr:aspartate--tRNA(Asn) ligase [Trueperaceae bacterium]